MKIVILADTATPEQRNAITTFVKNQNAGYWHWFADAWIIDTESDIDLSSWRDAIRDATSSGLHFLLFSFSEVENWAAFGNTKSFEWIHRHLKQ